MIVGQANMQPGAAVVDTAILILSYIVTLLEYLTMALAVISLHIT